MTTLWRNPRRLSEPGSDAPEILRQALQHARASRIADDSVERVAERLFPLIASGSITTVASRGAARLSLLTKTTCVFAVAGLLSTAAFVAYRIYDVAPQASGQPQVAAAALTPPLIEKERRAPPEGLAAARENIEPQVSSDAAIPANHKVLRPARERIAAKTAPPRPEPALELALLTRAQQALDMRPKQTMELVSEHERDYLHGIFAQEREMLAIEALLKLGKRDKALRRGQRFLRDYPESAHVRRVNNLMKQYPDQLGDDKT
jgi:hypothetical protein